MEYENIARNLSEKNPIKKKFETTAQQFISKSTSVLFDSGYGGEHWLASFAIFALSTK